MTRAINPRLTSINPRLTTGMTRAINPRLTRRYNNKYVPTIGVRITRIERYASPTVIGRSRYTLATAAVSATDITGKRRKKAISAIPETTWLALPTARIAPYGSHNTAEMPTSTEK